MSTSASSGRSMSNPLRDFSLGSVVTSDYVTPHTSRMVPLGRRSTKSVLWHGQRTPRVWVCGSGRWAFHGAASDSSWESSFEGPCRESDRFFRTCLWNWMHSFSSTREIIRRNGVPLSLSLATITSGGTVSSHINMSLESHHGSQRLLLKWWKVTIADSVRTVLLLSKMDHVEQKQIRAAANRAFFELDTYDAVRRALVGRVRPLRGPFLPGQLVYYWRNSRTKVFCEWDGVVVGDEAPLGGVAQVVSHGVKVVGVHREEGQEKGRGSAGGSKRRSRATQRETLIMDGMRMEWRTQGRLEPMWVWQVFVTKNTKQRAGVPSPTCCACWCTSCHCCHWPHWSWRRCCRYTLLRSHFVRDFLYQEMFFLHHPSVTIDCVDCYRYNHDKLCINFFLRFMPHMNSWFIEYTGFPVRSVFNPSLWWSLIIRMSPGSLPLPPWGGTLRPIFIVRLVLRFLEAMQSRQCFLEVRSMLCRCRIEIHQIRTDPPITTIYINFFLCGILTVVFAWKSIHFKDDFFRATPSQSSSFWTTCHG